MFRTFRGMAKIWGGGKKGRSRNPYAPVSFGVSFDMFCGIVLYDTFSIDFKAFAGKADLPVALLSRAEAAALVGEDAGRTQRGRKDAGTQEGRKDAERT